MKVLFLDFDGVLNSRVFFDNNLPAAGTGEDPDERIDPAAVARVNTIVARTGTEVVVSSMWRLSHSKGALQRILRRAGFVGRILGVTPMNHRPRGLQICKWLEDRDVKSFAILDDDGDMAPLMDSLVQTQFYDGLLDEHVEQAVAMLLSPMGAAR